jgi:hypothetical protein
MSTSISKKLSNQSTDENKKLKKITLKTPPTYKLYELEIENIITANEKAIIKYLKRNVYTNNIPESVNIELTNIFKINREQIQNEYLNNLTST